MTRFAAFAVALLISTGTTLAADGTYTPAQLAVFGTPHLQNIERPLSVTYDFKRDGLADGGFEDSVELVVTDVLADGSKNVEFRFLSGDRERHFPAMTGFRGNPLIMLFLQRDVEQLAAKTGGGSSYFRNRIRHAFHDRVTLDEVPVPVDGGERRMTRVTLKPFEDDPRRAALDAAEHKLYEFLLTPDIPGGVYRIRSLVPSPDGGGALIEETMTYSGTTE